MVEWLESVLSWPQYSLNSPSLDPVRDPISKNMIDGPRGPVNQGWHLIFTCMLTCMQPHMYLYQHEKYTQKEKKKNVCNICLYYCNLFIGYLASLIWPTFLWKQYIHEFHMKEHLKNLHSKKWYMILFISSIRSLGHWFLSVYFVVFILYNISYITLLQ